jgi:hypothetical protein
MAGPLLKTITDKNEAMEIINKREELFIWGRFLTSVKKFSRG